ncbi:dapper homolog 2 isoform X3 [Passer domesticus]|uniref:dapper homolog 2 isoform X3 n=1 Tax=Passer domesticus TaxID=48849 RepID=UPI0030FE1265
MGALAPRPAYPLERWPRHCLEPPPLPFAHALPLSLPRPHLSPKSQESLQFRFTLSGASGGGGREDLSAGTARSGSSPASSPLPLCHGPCRGPALTMLQGAPRPGGWDRGRVGERLQAALAGLQELQVLREKQRELVRAALAMPQRPAAGGEQQPLSTHIKEHRLEVTLSALKEQLSRLRRQDIGLKSHLDQLDQRISELKLDVSKSSSEYLDSDSRPSSGFYDLSDGGSCSLSNSCTSVYSESISSSHTSLLPSSQHPKTRLSVFDYRPKSADETTVHTTSFQQQGTYVSDGGRIAASRDVSGTPARSRPRPVSTESHQVRVKFASSKTKAVKIKRRNSEKVVRPGKQAFCMEKVRGSHGATKLPAEWNQLQRPQGLKSLMRRPSYSGDMAGRSCSESSLFPVQVRLPTVPSRLELYGASANALYSLEAACADTANRKKQRKWQSTVEISAKAHPASLSYSFGPGAPRQPVGRAGVLRTVSMRAHSKGQHYGDCAKSESDHSEYSAECASLFHSTIAETSEGEVSDFTTNRFGDSESSEGDWDGSSNSSSLALDYDVGDESELIWPEGSVRQSVTVQASSKPLPPVPKICRIKASKALKKKIRRFQPASLKVMTMV